MAETGTKRRRPPTFQHLPIKRAKKLKQTWVENVKIKSKWKAQKRKEAALAGLSHTTGHNENDNEASDSDGSAKLESDEDPIPQKSTLHPSRVHIHPELAPKSIPKSQRAEKSEEPPTTLPSLRDLTREAYSLSSLHTFKSDPLNKRRGSYTRGRGEGRGRGQGAPRGEKGRGQPNMKLRMDAMLEKIKRDLV